ncbi:MAG TPA: DUF6326 family protein [Pyrinomonadaceae bacterium]
MNAHTKADRTKDRRVLLSTLWIFVMFNYLYADLVMMIVNPAIYERAATKMTSGVILGFTALMEILIAMVLLSRILKYKANRWANIIAGIIGTTFVGITVNARAPAFYLFLSSIEILTTLFIVWCAWTWHNPEDETVST